MIEAVIRRCFHAGSRNFEKFVENWSTNGKRTIIPEPNCFCWVAGTSDEGERFPYGGESETTQSRNKSV